MMNHFFKTNLERTIYDIHRLYMPLPYNYKRIYIRYNMMNHFFTTNLERTMYSR